MRNDGQVIIKFLFKLLKIADIINTLVEAPGEFWRDGLERRPNS